MCGVKEEFGAAKEGEGAMVELDEKKQGGTRSESREICLSQSADGPPLCPAAERGMSRMNLPCGGLQGGRNPSCISQLA